MCLVPTHMTFVNMNSINETLDIFLPIFMKEMQSIYIPKTGFTVIYCHLHIHVDGIVVRPLPAKHIREFKHACLVFG